MASSHESETAIAVVDPLVGTIFDKRFHIDERLAAGGFGAIYRATHVKSGHEIALKILHPTLASDLGVLARFRREGTTLTSLRNPHTITAYEYGEWERMLFIVLELLHGESLFEHYRAHGPLPWKRVVHIAQQVCESLEEAHALGIVHRDLKPTNIHLEKHGDDPDYVKVLDFGIAKILRGSELDSADITNAGQMIGTLDYMSPEQMVGGQVTGQTDIFTLGIVMYEMIAGTRPFPESETAAAALAALLKTTPEPIHRRVPVPRALDAVVMRCLERDTEKRHRDVRALRDELEAVAADAAPSNTATVQIPAHGLHEDDATTITPPPEKMSEPTIDLARRPSVAPVDDLDEQTVDMSRRLAVAPADLDRRSVHEAPEPPDGRRRLGSTAAEMTETAPRPRYAPPVNERNTAPSSKHTPLPEWGDDDELVPTTARRPDSVKELAGATSPASAPALRPNPRPLPHPPAPIPNLVAAPFSQKPRAAAKSIDPLAATAPASAIEGDGLDATVLGHAPARAQSPNPTPAPGVPRVLPPTPGAAAPALGVPPTPAPFSAPAGGPAAGPGLAGLPPGPLSPTGARTPSAKFDMSRFVAQEATVRRIIWIAVLVIGAAVGFVLALRM